MGFTREMYKLGFEISPVILCGGIAQAIPGGMLPIVALTQSASFVTGLLGGAINLPIWINISATGARFRAPQWLIMKLPDTLSPTR